MKIHLINMPFGYLRLPSIALTQLKAIIQRNFDHRVSTEIHYLNLDFGVFLGTQLYNFIAENPAAMQCNIGEWFFRQATFPEIYDNTDSYLDHFGLRLDLKVSMEANQNQLSTDCSGDKATLRFFTSILLDKRKQLDDFLNQLIDTYRLDQCDVVGFTSMFAQNLPAFALARKLKEKNPGLFIVMGGANCESPMGEEILRRMTCIDYVFSGPALISFPQFIDHILKGRLEDCDRIDGVFSRQNVLCLEAVVKPRGEELDINTWIDLDFDEYIQLVKTRWKMLLIQPVLLFETSRGCWWGAKAHCTFCGLNTSSMAYRAMDPEMAVSYLNQFFMKYGSRVKHFSSVDNIMPREYLQTVFPRLKVPRKVSIFYEVKADLSKEELEVLSSAGIKTLQPGIESLDTATLKRMKKGETAVGNLAFLKNAENTGHRIAWNLLIGFPGDPDSAYDVYGRDFYDLYHLQPPKSVYPVRFDRYSPYFMKPEDHGLLLVPADFYHFLYPEKEMEGISRLAYYFEDANAGAGYKMLASRWLPLLSERVYRWALRYNGMDRLLKAQLFWDLETNRIHDSRSGKLLVQAVSPLGLRLLILMDQPVKWISLVQALKDTEPAEIEKELERLIEYKFVYHENRKKFLSLVINSSEIIPYSATIPIVQDFAQDNPV